jgi:hypothetical protein
LVIKSVSCFSFFLFDIVGSQSTADEIAALKIDPFSSVKAKSLHGLTQGLVLHQVAAGVAAIAFLLAACSHRLGYLVASAVAFIAFLFSLASMVIDFVLFGVCSILHRATILFNNSRSL